MGDTMWMTTTWKTLNGSVWSVDLNDPDQSRWTSIVPEREDAVLRGVSHARGMLVARYVKDAVTGFERYAMNGRSLGALETPGLGSASLSTQDDRTEAFMSYSSFNDPRSIYRVDLSDGTSSVWDRPTVPVDTSTVAVSQIFTTSKDGTRVPYFLVHHKDVTPER